MRFSWDAKKAAGNLRKHGVEFDEAATVLADPLALDIADLNHPERVITLGCSARERLLLVVSAEIDEDDIHIISARRPTAHERKRYEEGA